MRDSCPYEVFHSSSSLFLLQVPFFYLKDGSSPPRSHYKHCSNIFICCRGITGKGGTSSDSPFSSVSRVTLIPGPVSGVFCLALQAYQVRSGAFVSGILLFPQADGFFVVQMSANRCLKKKMSWLCLTELHPSFVPMQSHRLVQFVFREPRVFF